MIAMGSFIIQVFRMKTYSPSGAWQKGISDEKIQPFQSMAERYS